jgi:hypothetical protein
MADSPAAAPAGHPVRSPARPLGSFREDRSFPLVPAPRLAARTDYRERLFDQLAEDFDRTLLTRDEADALARHQRSAFNIAIDDRTAQRPRPEMLDFELGILLA